MVKGGHWSHREGVEGGRRKLAALIPQFPHLYVRIRSSLTHGRTVNFLLHELLGQIVRREAAAIG